MASDTLAPPAVDTPASGIVVRELEPGEYNRIHEAGGPLAGYDLSAIDHMRIIAVEEAGQIIGYWAVAVLVHAEPLWLGERARGRPGVVRRLLNGLVALLQRLDCQVAFGVINDKDFDINLPMARRLGFERVPGDLYVIKVPTKVQLDAPLPPAPAAGED